MNNVLLNLCLLCAYLKAAAGQDYLKNEIGFGVDKLKHKKNVLTATTTCDNVQQFWFKDAVVDNFSPIENQKLWAGEGQQYWLNKQFWGGAGFPIFVFIGGEGAESCGRLTNRMYVYELAQQHKALMLNVEHRFYGQSYPTVDMSTENLKYLSADQALADLARIIGHVKSDLNTVGSKVITVGGSYPGNLAAWFRLKYPSVTHGSISSSAPVTAQTNFKEYMDVVGQSIIHFSGQKCFDAFETAANEVARLASHRIGSKEFSQLDVDFNTCEPMKTHKDLSILYSDIMGNVQGTIQYNNEHNGVMNVTDICNIMLSTEDAYTGFVKLTAAYQSANGQACEPASWDTTVDYLAATAKDPTNAARPWTYQTCNEFGYFQTADSLNQPFHAWNQSLSLDFYRDLCSASFNNWKSDPQTAWINQAYGDVRIDATNIAFAAGTIDPWHALGVTNFTATLPQFPSEEPVFIEGTAHCNDLYAPASSDPASLTFARSFIAEKVAKWLA